MPCLHIGMCLAHLSCHLASLRRRFQLNLSSRQSRRSCCWLHCFLGVCVSQWLLSELHARAPVKGLIGCPRVKYYITCRMHEIPCEMQGDLYCASSKAGPPQPGQTSGAAHDVRTRGNFDMLFTTMFWMTLGPTNCTFIRLVCHTMAGPFNRIMRVDEPYD